MMLFLKACAHLLAAPLGTALALTLAAGLSRLVHRPRFARGLLWLAVLTAYAGALPAVGDALIGPLERAYPAFSDVVPLPPVRWIVVLGSDYEPRRGVPVTGALDPDGLARIVEGVRLVRRTPSSHLLVSGGAGPGRAPPAQGYARLARDLGVPDEALAVSDRSLDTDAEAHAVAAALGPERFLLVTSAYHMPRAMRLMQRAGAHPIAAPTGQRLGPAHGLDPAYWFPSAGGLLRTERALHEYLGLLALQMGAS